MCGLIRGQAHLNSYVEISMNLEVKSELKKKKKRKQCGFIELTLYLVYIELL